jgi:hypothetical protein
MLAGILLFAHGMWLFSVDKLRQEGKFEEFDEKRKTSKFIYGVGVLLFLDALMGIFLAANNPNFNFADPFYLLFSLIIIINIIATVSLIRVQPISYTVFIVVVSINILLSTGTSILFEQFGLNQILIILFNIVIIRALITERKHKYAPLSEFVKNQEEPKKRATL